MKINSSTFWMIGVSLFFGLMCVALGTAIPPLMAIGGPLVCGGGEFGIDSQTYSYKPGQIGVTRSPYCIDQQTNDKKDVTFPLIVVDTLIYGTIIFVLLMLAGSRMKSSPAAAGSQGGWLGSSSSALSQKNRSQGRGTRERLAELKELRASDLITEQEYERKKAELLKDL